MEQSSTAFLHFPIMIFASFILFYCVIWIVLGSQEFILKFRYVFILSILVVVFGMLFGKFGANWGLKWWIYYPLPMLMNILLPPLVLKMTSGRTVFYLISSFLSAPLIHLSFSYFFNWKEYMPFWEI